MTGREIPQPPPGAFAALQPQLPPKQILYPATMIDVVTAPDGSVVLQIAVPASNELLIIPMPVAAAKEIGQKLIAPRVVPASNGPV